MQRPHIRFCPLRTPHPTPPRQASKELSEQYASARALAFSGSKAPSHVCARWDARAVCRRKVVKFREVLDQMFTSVTAMDFGSSLNPSPSAAALTAAAADGRLRPATAATADSEVRARAMSAVQGPANDET